LSYFNWLRVKIFVKIGHFDFLQLTLLIKTPINSKLRAQNSKKEDMMRIIEYRKVPFVDREKEEKWLLERFSQEPAKILFIYGPKSSGKTTLMEYLVENVLKKDKSRNGS